MRTWAVAFFFFRVIWSWLWRLTRILFDCLKEGWGVEHDGIPGVDTKTQGQIRWMDR